jgi:type IV secretory pathway VirD2 relaxase
MRRLSERSRGAVIKACGPASGQARALRAHLGYLRREGATRDGAPGRMFDAERDDADYRGFSADVRMTATTFDSSYRPMMQTGFPTLRHLPAT